MPDRTHSAGYGRSTREQPVYGRSPPRRSRSLLVLLPVLAFFAGFGAIVWLAYVHSSATSTSGEPPLIRADDRPIKVPPDDPGGRVVADQGELRDLFSDEPEPVTERLLPLPEEPLPPPSAEALAQRADDLTPETAASAGPDESAASTVPPATAATAGASSAAPDAPDEAAPAAAEEEGIGEPPATAAAIASLLEETGAGGPAAETPATAAAARPADQVTGSTAPDAATPTPAVAERAAERPAAAPSQAAPAPEPAPEPEPEPEPEREQQTLLARAPNPATALPRPAASLDEPHYRIQLAAVRNEADARRAWDLFRLDLSELLAGVEPIIERGETGNGVFYRVQLGPYADAGQAEDLCEEFKQRNASCFVLRR